jgi:hypothetical protein
MKHETLIREKEIRTIGSRGLWTVDQVSKTRKFKFQEDKQAGFVKREIMKCSKDWPMVKAKGHIGEGE